MPPAPGSRASCMVTTTSIGTARGPLGTPAQHHQGQDHTILASRHALYQRTPGNTPTRCSGMTHDWARYCLIPKRKRRSRPRAPDGCFSVPAQKNNARARSARKESSRDTPSHAQRLIRREHRDDGQNRTLAEAYPGTLGQVGHNRRPIQPHQSRVPIKEGCYEIRAATHLISTASTVATPVGGSGSRRATATRYIT